MQGLVEDPSQRCVFLIIFSIDVIALASKTVQYLVIAIPFEVNLCLFNR